MLTRRVTLAGIGGVMALPWLGCRAQAAEPHVLKAGIALENNRVEIAVGMNGEGPYIFMIDTGTYVSLIRPDLAKQLKLPVTGYERTRGIGGNGQPFAIYLAKDFVIGGGIRQSTVVLEDSFDFGYQGGVYGALAAGILTAADTDLDFDAGELRIYPDGRGARPGYVALDSEIPWIGPQQHGSRKISATLVLNGQSIRCVLDTGAPVSLFLNRAAAHRLGLWNDGRPYAPIRPKGIGGAGPLARIVRADSLMMGGTRLDRPLVTLLDIDIADQFDGTAGLSLLRHFNLSIDTHGHKLWVQPSRQQPAPEHYGMSGLWLDRDGDRIKVASVGTGSPAAAAEIAVGDVITGSDFAALLRQLGGPAGNAVPLTIERGGQKRDVTLTLSQYL